MTQYISLSLLLSCSALVLACDSTVPSEPGPVSSQAPAAPELALASNSWTARAPIPSGRYATAAAVVNDPAGPPILYVLGGLNLRGETVPAIEAFNYSTNSWTTKRPRFGTPETNGVGVISGKLYISGGLSDAEASDLVADLYVYDPARDVLTRKADLPYKMAKGVSGVIGGKLYVLTGQCSGCPSSATRRLYRYNPNTNTWSTLPSSPRGHLFGAGGVIGNKFYVAGGVHGNSVTGYLDAYDPATNSWTSLASMPARVSLAGAAVIKNQLYVIGGSGSPGGRGVFAYNPATNSWKRRADLLTARSFVAAASLITPSGNPKILAVGGDSEVGLRANERYTP